MANGILALRKRKRQCFDSTLPEDGMEEHEERVAIASKLKITIRPPDRNVGGRITRQNELQQQIGRRWQ
jgi:hypothetical protein